MRGTPGGLPRQARMRTAHWMPGGAVIPWRKPGLGAGTRTSLPFRCPQGSWGAPCGLLPARQRGGVRGARVRKWQRSCRASRFTAGTVCFAIGRQSAGGLKPPLRLPVCRRTKAAAVAGLPSSVRRRRSWYSLRAVSNGRCYAEIRYGAAAAQSERSCPPPSLNRLLPLRGSTRRRRQVSRHMSVQGCG